MWSRRQRTKTSTATTSGQVVFLAKRTTQKNVFGWQNVVVYRNLRTGHSESADLEELLEWWNDAGYVEITRWDDILAVIKKYLTPFLGSVIVGALVTWLLGRLK